MWNVSLGFFDKNGKEIHEGDHVHVFKRGFVAVTDGWGQGSYGSAPYQDEYDGHVYYDNARAEFRIDDERFGERQRSRNLYEFDEITVIGE